RTDLEIRAGHEPETRHRLEMPLDVRGGEHAENARRVRGGGRVDAADLRVRGRASENGRMGHPPGGDVVGGPRGPGGEPGILTPADPRSEDARRGGGRRHGRPPVAAACCTARTMFW